MDIPDLRVENRTVTDPETAHLRDLAFPNNLQKQTHKELLSPPHFPHTPSPEAPPTIGAVSVGKRLQTRLREELPLHIGTQWQIAQPHILLAILTSEEILSLLREYQHYGSVSQDEDVEALCKKLRGHGHPSCIVVLAMLLLVDKGFTICEVLRDEVFDKNLPLRITDDKNPELFFQDRSTGKNKRLRCFEDDRKWGWHTKLDICKWQWYLRVPYMEVRGASFCAYENKFGPDIVLPWTRKNEDDEIVRDNGADAYGAYSSVYMRHIDDRFHGFHEVLQKIGLSGGRGLFAVKVLDTSNPDQKAYFKSRFEIEKRHLKRFNGIAHNHLVTLLAAFEQENTDNIFFVFPWAEYSLSAYWESKQPGDAQWISQQLQGLVGALNEIHNPKHDSQTLESRVHGRHGDINPDSILWFTPYMGDPRGILVLSSISSTAIDNEISPSSQITTEPFSPIYCSPERDISRGKVTRQCDIWSLGCVFLEMITWILGGNQLNQEFNYSRRSTNDEGVWTFKFFEIDEGQPVVKKEVAKWVDKLRSHENVTDFTHAVLDVVQKSMIVPHAGKRSKVQDLKITFDMINEKYEQCESGHLPENSNQPIASIQTDEPYAMVATFDNTGNMPDSTRNLESVDSPGFTEGPVSNEPTRAGFRTEYPDSIGFIDSTITGSVEMTATSSANESGATPLTTLTAPKSSVNFVEDDEYESGLNSLDEFSIYSMSDRSSATLDVYSESFAKSLFKGLVDEFPIDSLEKVSKALAENLKGFATRLRHDTHEKTQLDIGVFAQKYREHIKKAFETLIENRKQVTTRVRPEETVFNTNAWVGNLISYDKSPDFLSNIPSLSPLPSPKSSPVPSPESSPVPSPAPSIHNVVQGRHQPDNNTTTDNAVTSEDEAFFKSQETLERFIEYQNIVKDTAAYEWLVGMLRRDACLQPAAQNGMEMIRNEILRHLPVGKISRTSPSKTFEVEFVLEWNPWTFVADLGLDGRPEQALRWAITFTGSPDDGQALVCSEYLTQTWPTNGGSSIELIIELVKSKSGTECNKTMPDGTRMRAYSQNGSTIINVTGVVDAVAEVGQQLAWIGAALRSAPSNFEQGLCECSPKISREMKEDERENERTFAMRFEIRGPTDYTNVTGSCWHSMLRNPVLVTGFPIREKSARKAGIEMPFDIMACLARSNRVVNFDGKMVLKGFSTMLTAVQSTAEYLIWHYTFRADGSRIPFFEAERPEQEDIHFGLLETCRHIVGWCSSAKYHTGDPEATCDVEECYEPPFKTPLLMDKITLSVGKVGVVGANLSFPVNNVPVHITLTEYADKLEYLDKEFVVFWDTRDKRGWLVNGMSALLHLVRAKFKNVASGDHESSYISDLSRLTKTANRYHPTRSADEILRDLAKRRLKIRNGDAAQSSEQNMNPSEEIIDEKSESKEILDQNDADFEKFVERYMSYLEQIQDYQASLMKSNGLELKARNYRQLAGWDFVDLLTTKRPFLRVAKIDRLGWGWVDFVRSIGALTIFGQGFGELIEPENKQMMCPEWRTLPKDKYYLAASAIDLFKAMKTHGTPVTNPPQLVHGYYWYSPSPCPCRGEANFNKKHHDPTQLLLKNISSILNRKKLTGPQGLDRKNNMAAFVFGHNSGFSTFLSTFGRDTEISPGQNLEDSPNNPALDVEDHGSQSVEESTATSQRISSSISAQLDITSVSSVETPTLPTPIPPPTTTTTKTTTLTNLPTTAATATTAPGTSLTMSPTEPVASSSWRNRRFSFRKHVFGFLRRRGNEI